MAEWIEYILTRNSSTNKQRLLQRVLQQYPTCFLRDYVKHEVSKHAQLPQWHEQQRLSIRHAHACLQSLTL